MTIKTKGRGYRAEHGVIFARPEGRPLKAALYIPDNGDPGPWPALALFHGGGFALGTRYQQRWYCKAFARAGYVVMTADYRLMPSHRFPCAVHDAKAAARWLRMNAPRLHIDPERISAFGASAGGMLAAFLAVTGPEGEWEGGENPGFSSGVNAAISLYGVTDLTSYLNAKGCWGRLARRYLARFAGAGHGADTREWFTRASPSTYAGPDTRPMLFAHGTADHVVRFDQSAEFHQRLESYGVPTKLLTLPGRGHGFDYIYWSERRAVFEEMRAFLDTHNRPPAASGDNERKP